MLDQVVAFFDLWDRYKRWRAPEENRQTESIAARFARLFETHGVHPNQIPRVFGLGIQLRDVQDDASLLSRLDEDILDAACAYFAVRREWLDGAESQVHTCHRFYKDPHSFAGFIHDLKIKNPTGRIAGVVIAPIETDRNAEALLILEESIGFVGEKPIHRYHLCDSWMFSYWKARAYLTACIAIARKNNIYVHGTYALKKNIDALAGGEILLGWRGEGIYSLGMKRWDPEDMTLSPDAFLKGVDPEKGEFGLKAGLRLWLDLEQQRFMDTGFNEDARLLFQRELAKYQN